MWQAGSVAALVCLVTGLLPLDAAAVLLTPLGS